MKTQELLCFRLVHQPLKIRSNNWQTILYPIIWWNIISSAPFLWNDAIEKAVKSLIWVQKTCQPKKLLLYIFITEMLYNLFLFLLPWILKNNIIYSAPKFQTHKGTLKFEGKKTLNCLQLPTWSSWSISPYDAPTYILRHCLVYI